MQSGRSLSGRERNCAFVNAGGGRFVTASAVTGFDVLDDSRAIATTDWDRDGRLDAWMSGRTAPAIRFLRNEHEGAGGWVTFRLQGGGMVNRDAIGTRLEVKLGAETTLVRTLRAGDGYLSQSEKLLHFGLGGAKRGSATVIWPDGKRVELGAVQSGAHYRVVYPGKIEALAWPGSGLDFAKGEALEAVPFSSQGAMRLVYPVPLPDLQFRAPDGSLGALGPPGEGRFRLLNLWNPSCEGCEEELTALTKRADDLRAAGVSVMAALGPGEAGMEEAVAMLKTMRSPFGFGQLSEHDTALLDQVVDAVFVMERDLVLPTSFLIGGDGRLEAIYLGPLEPDALLADVALLRKAAGPPARRARVLYGEGGRWEHVEGGALFMQVPLTMMRQGRVPETAAYIRKWSDGLSVSEEYGRLLVWVADEQVKRGASREAQVFYLNALNWGANDPVVMNNAAWQMATHRDPRLRNGVEAVKWAAKAVELTGGVDPTYLDTLAAAYAEAGDFPKAIATVRRGLELAKQQNNPGVYRSLLQGLQFYDAGQPFRSP